MQRAWSNYPHQTANFSRFGPLGAKIISNPLTLRVSQLKVRIKYTYDLHDIIRMNSTKGIRGSEPARMTVKYPEEIETVRKQPGKNSWRSLITTKFYGCFS